jgi:hypothetical protein
MVGSPLAGGAVAVVVAAAVVTVLGVWPDQSSRRQAMCARPTATADMARSPVRSSGALRVGPLTFHPMPFANDGLVAVVLHPVAVVPPGFTLSGWECGDGRPLRFWYQSYGTMGPLPVRLSRAAPEGQLVVAVPPRAAGDDLLGYMQFSGPGRWSVEVRDGAATLGNIVFIV